MKTVCNYKASIIKINGNLWLIYIRKGSLLVNRYRRKIHIGIQLDTYH